LLHLADVLPTGKDLAPVFHDHYHSYGLLMDRFDSATAKCLRRRP